MDIIYMGTVKLMNHTNYKIPVIQKHISFSNSNVYCTWKTSKQFTTTIILKLQVQYVEKLK